MAHWIRKESGAGGGFEPVRFSGWPELKEALLSRHLDAAFMLAPMALVLAEQGAPLRVVYLGHREGSALVVARNSTYRTLGDLAGRRIAVPNRFSNQYLLIYRGLKERGLGPKDVELVEMPPPDMPAALAVGAVDAIISGEPFMGQAELDGTGRVLHQAGELWPGFISCVLVARRELIDGEPGRLQELVDGIARSGLWLDRSMAHRRAAADIVAGSYYHQRPELLRFVLTGSPDRVTYSRLALARPEFERIAELALEVGLLPRPIAFEAYADERFSAAAQGLTAWDFEPGGAP